MRKVVLHKRTWLAGLFFTICVILFIYVILKVLDRNSDDAAAKQVKIILGVTHAGLDEWLTVNSKLAEYYAGSAFIKETTKKLLDPALGQQALQQQKIHRWYKKVADQHSFLDFFVIDADGVNIASSRDSSFWPPGLLHNRERLLDKVISGQRVINIPLQAGASSPLNSMPQDNIDHMLTIAPVYDVNQKFLAALAFRINPANMLNKLLAAATLGNDVKIMLIDRAFRPLHLGTEYSFTDALNPAVVTAATNILTRDDYRSGQAVLLDLDLHRYQVGAVLWDQSHNMGLFAYMDEAAVHKAYSQTNRVVFLLSIAITSLIWLSLWTVERSHLRVRRTKDWLENLLNAIPSIICVIDKNGLLRFSNNNLQKLEGLKNKIIGSQPIRINNPQHSGCLDDGFLGDVWGPWCIRYISPDTHEQVINFERVNIADENGRPVDLVLANNVTEYINVELEKQKLLEQLRQAQKMEAIGQLTGGVAHDFNNMLSAIIGYTHLSLDYFADDNQKLKEYLGEIERAGSRAQMLVQQMLAYSRNNKGASQHIDPAVTLNESLKLLKSTIPSSIEIIEKTSERKLAIVVDPVQLQQVIMNLVINARDAINEKGIVVCSIMDAGKEHAFCSSCHEEFSGHYVAITIQDTGEGMDADQQSKIFEPFYTSKAVGKGSGMGLSMVHGIVHSAGGHIIVNSKRGLGTEIVLLFPEVIDKDNYVRQESA